MQCTLRLRVANGTKCHPRAYRRWHSDGGPGPGNRAKSLICLVLATLAQPLLYAFQLPNKHNSQETHHALRTSRYRRREGFLQEPLRQLHRW
ncbi:protein of unknown function [Pseudomonas sp. JV551A1]|uniref:Uncharacterized protein n=1 Tax=Pseudomonas inefficax TaxID=2078786 RepID=A0AAQ1P755_9PSED|nr:protein of unknown function [Pseudomonas sp. JV551A1]SPO59058.1 protein of unknown function [Pseudomonas inefficax]